MVFQHSRLLAVAGLSALVCSCQGDSDAAKSTSDASAGMAAAAAGAPPTAGGAGESAGGKAGNSAAGSGNAGTSNAGSAGTAGSTTGGASNAGAPAGGSSHGGTAAGNGGTEGEPGGAGGEAPATNGCIVPLYSYPNAASWSAIVKAKQAHPNVDVVAIVNPDNGPGATVDATFTSGIAKLVAGGVVPIGYVSTNYTKRGQDAVNTDSDKWHTAYPAVQGIFFDEQSNQAGDEAFYAAVSAHAKSLGLAFTVGNPGTGVPSSYLGSVDVMLAYESDGTPTLASLQKYAAHRESYGIIPYETGFDAAFVRAAAQSVRYIYLTDDDLPNPWDSLPSYFDQLLGALAP